MTKKKDSKLQRGRPSKYTEDLANEICERIVNGESVVSIVKDEHMPVMSTVFYWLTKNEIFSEMYTEAKRLQAEKLADEIMDIADNSTNDWVETQGDDRAKDMYRVNGEAINRSRLRVDARKWVAARLLPAKYGDRVENVISNKEGESFKLKKLSSDELMKRITELENKTKKS